MLKQWQKQQQLLQQPWQPQQQQQFGQTNGGGDNSHRQDRRMKEANKNDNKQVLLQMCEGGEPNPACTAALLSPSDPAR